MAMTKKEKAEFEAMAKELRVQSALRWTEKIAPDLPIPSSGCTQGWAINSYDGIVREAWSQNIRHGNGLCEPDNWRQSASQNGVPLFSTKLLALKAVRHEMEKEFAKKLAAVDEAIAKARGEA